MAWYSQNDPAWSNVNLGFGPAKIGPYGCLLTSFANLGHFVAGGNTNPPGLSGFLMNLGRFIQGDLLGDNALDGLFDCHFVETVHFENGPADLKYPQDAFSEQYIIEIDASPAAGIQTHFVLYYDGHTAANFRVVDPWDGTVKFLKAYGDPASIIQKMTHYRVVHPAAAPAAPAPAPVVPAPAPATPATDPKAGESTPTPTSTPAAPAPTPVPSVPETPSAPPITPKNDTDQNPNSQLEIDNNNLLKQILAIVQNILAKLTSVFK